MPGRFKRDVQVRFFRRHALALDDGARAARFCAGSQIIEFASAASRSPMKLRATTFGVTNKLFQVLIEMK
jgi:hypothetical protein